jgi:hypothetical protein
MSLDFKTLAEKWDSSGHRNFTPNDIGWLLDEVERLNKNQLTMLNALVTISVQGGDVVEQWAARIASDALSSLKD